MKSGRFAQGCESALLIIGLYYLSYRYPFQIGSSSTCTGYTDTPIFLQIGKYALIAGFLLLHTFAAPPRLPATRVYAAILIGAIYLAFAGIACTILTGHFECAESAIVWAIGAVLLRRDTVGIAPYVGKLKTFSVIAVLFVILQGILFVTTGRLPGVSLENSILVRFGSLWDDPNGFAIACSLIVPLLWRTIRSWSLRIFFLAASLVCLIATQSLTGLLAFAATMAIGTLLLLIFGGLRNLGGFLFFSLVGFACLAGAMWIAFQMQDYLAMKSGSIEGHLDSLVVLANSNWTAWIGWAPVDQWGEMAYVNWIVNYGVLYTIVHVAMLALMVLSCAILCRKHREYVPILYFLVAYCAGLGNLPLDTVFPVNVLAVFCGIVSVRHALSREVRTEDLHVKVSDRRERTSTVRYLDPA